MSSGQFTGKAGIRVQHANTTAQIPINAASSTGRCNTVQRLDSTVFPRESHLFGSTRSKLSQSGVPAGLTLTSNFSFCFQCQAGSSLALHRPIEITAVTGKLPSARGQVSGYANFPEVLTRNRWVGQREPGPHESFSLASPYSSVSKPRGDPPQNGKRDPGTWVGCGRLRNWWSKRRGSGRRGGEAMSINDLPAIMGTVLIVAGLALVGVSTWSRAEGG
jgi:hypothetical protein